MFEDILKDIALSGAATESNVIIASAKHLNLIASLASGKARITKSFDLILSQPESLLALSPFDIRCTVCRKVINYPCWYRKELFSVNQFHFFVCFDSRHKSKPTCTCLKGLM